MILCCPCGEDNSQEGKHRSALSEQYLSTPGEDTLLPSLVLILRELVEEYKNRMLNSAKKSFSNPKAKPNSNLAALIDEAKRLRFIKSLIPSRGTLIVIPSVLMDHWEVRTSFLRLDFVEQAPPHSFSGTNQYAHRYNVSFSKASLGIRLRR